MSVGDVTKGVKAQSRAAARVVVSRIAASLSAKEVREPRTPTKRLEAEARRIAAQIARDEATLRTKSAFTKSDVFILEAATELFAEAASQLFLAHAPNLPSKVTQQRRAADSLLRAVWLDLQYLAEECDDADLLTKLGILREGDSLDDTVNDLELTMPLVRKYAQMLGATGSVGTAQAETKLAEYHRGLSLEQRAPHIDDTYSALKQRRDRLGLVLEAHLARIRRHGKKAFADDATRAGKYIDSYRSETRAAKRAARR